MSPQRYLAYLLAVTLAYWATAVLGLRWSIVPGAGTAVWPASGVAFAALVLLGLQFWPAVVLGRLLTFATVGSALPLWAEIAVSLGTTAAAALPIWLLNRKRRLDPRLSNMRDMLWLIVGGAVLGAAISAGTGILALLGSGTEGAKALAAGLNWFFGYAVGLLVFAPLILSWLPARRAAMSRQHLLHFLFCVGLNTAAATYLFLSPSQPYLRVWHLFPFLVWASVSFQVRGASLVLLILSGVAIAGDIMGSGPLAFGGLSIQDRTLLTQQFVGMIGGTVLLLAAAVEERQNIEAAARLAAIVRSSPEAMISYDADGKVRSWNKGAEQLFGYSADDVCGRSGEMLLPPEQPEGPTGVFGLAKEAGGPIHIETSRMNKAGERIDVAISASPMFDPNGPFLGVAAVMRDISERRRAELHQRLLIGELNHRVKNTLAVIQGLAQQTFKDVPGGSAAREAFEGRVMALASAHNILTDRKWEMAGFREIVEAAIRPFVKKDDDWVSVAGPDFMLRPQTAVSFAMVIHELATNAVKYGALRSTGGNLEVRWLFDEENGDFRFDWREFNHSPIAKPTRKGFGSRLIARSLAAEVSAKVQANYTDSGLHLTIVSPNFALGEARPPVMFDFEQRPERREAEVDS